MSTREGFPVLRRFCGLTTMPKRPLSSIYRCLIVEALRRCSEIQGWLKDRFGLFWQIVPARLPQLLQNPKPMKAMMSMKKLNIAELERAAQE